VIGNFPRALAFTLGQEGGWSNRPDDHPTMQGITLATYQSWCFAQSYPPPSADDLREIDAATVAEIYHDLYWQAVSANGLPDGADLSCFDMAVNSGPGTSVRQLQTVLRVAADGIVGPDTIKAAQRASVFVVIANLADAQERYYRSLADFPTFGAGWLARVEARRRAAMALASGRIA
jgi:lysozyme family protein